MTLKSRRAVLQLGLGLTFPMSIAAQLTSSQPMPQSDPEKAKRDFVRQVNKYWEAAHQKAIAAAKQQERRGVFASLAPPEQLVPFKDWDFYYTKGLRARWTPNAGQTFKQVVVPAGFVTDLTSIPQPVWSFGLRPEGPYAYAAVVHDYLYWMQERPKQEADQIFLYAMEDSKVEVGLRNRIYKAVNLLGGSAWDRNAALKKSGERRFLQRFPTDFTISWSEWKQQPGVFRD